MRTASGSARPSLAARVSAACCPGLSPGPRATAMPPWAQELALSARLSLVTRTAGIPSEAIRHAVQRPAIPVPTITGRGVGMKEKYIASRPAASRPHFGQQHQTGKQKKDVRNPRRQGGLDEPARSDRLGNLDE